MPRATLDDLEVGFRDQAQHFSGLLAHILGPRMTGKVQRHRFGQRG